MCNFRACFRIQRTYRMPKDIHVEPERFAAELISRLETVLREREAQERLEERLKRVRLVSAPPCVCARVPCDVLRFFHCHSHSVHVVLHRKTW